MNDNIQSKRTDEEFETKLKCAKELAENESLENDFSNTHVRRTRRMPGEPQSSIKFKLKTQVYFFLYVTGL